MTADIAVSHVSRSFGAHKVLDDVSLTVAPGELLALLGPSGSGKTTLLRLIAGLDQPDSGRITIGDIDASSRKPKERGVGFVFQHYALFRHMSVFENIAFPLRVRKAGKTEIRARVVELLRLIQLEALAKRYPSQLSGGQRQRVALARALASQPRVLLLDEPFGALDAVVRRDLRRWLHHLHREMNITTIFVTHDQEEAFELADRVVIMQQGRISQQGTPMDIYRQPANIFVHEFLGESNRIACHVVDLKVRADAGYFLGQTDGADGAATAFVRPHQIAVRPSASGPWRVAQIASSGTHARLTLAWQETRLESGMTADALLAAGLAVGTPVDIAFTGGAVFREGGAPSALQNQPEEKSVSDIGRTQLSVL
ncbi:MAG TPA: sulfate ABC transporter ATP-binding protein [Acidocella sp.]|jgi:sulfate transport system ATP-binding protein|uniref:sulfate/molybdate ABC transporter ATP-binding protein n=1 Tax=Acidocella sp. TaxID=50710 RepID=UPI002B64E7E6|nr:sulfate ABC transporter ATP-binding protein [Acidocella sp.]HVE21289.1 sulfate ABC transporter ATP-binding protein [Acidocella sp.]